MYSSYAWSKLIYCVFVFHLWIIFTYPIIEFHLQAVWIIVYTMMFIVLKGRKQCSLVEFLFWEGVDVVAYPIAVKSQLF
jgi:hypothetical protein